MLDCSSVQDSQPPSASLGWIPMAVLLPGLSQNMYLVVNGSQQG